MIRLDAMHGQRLFPADRPGKVADHARKRSTFMRRMLNPHVQALFFNHCKWVVYNDV